MEKSLLILPCCAGKIPGGKSKINKLTYFENIEYVPDLIRAREINLQNHPIVDGGKYMCAWDRYNGGLYKNLKAHQNLIDDLIKRGCLDIVIVSALYGVINYNTEINNYDLMMSQGGLSRLWDDHIVSSIQNYKLETGITHTYIALSNSYLNVANRNGGLDQITDLWVYGLRGVQLINQKVAENIINKLKEISEKCKSN
jgi:hypothetical protein